MLGWNIQYGFNDSDFEVSENLLSIYLDEYEETPWDALKYLVSLVVRAWPVGFDRVRPWDSFLERPGNLTGPESDCDIKFSRKVGCVLTSN